MNSRAISFIKNFSYTLTSNLISLVVSILIILIIPKLIGIEEYGYWQLYLFYSSYVGFLHFGWNDGIYLRYGGKEYKSLDKKLFFSQFYMLLLFQLIIALIISIISVIFVENQSKFFIVQMTVFCMVIVNIRFNLMYLLQGTNRIKEYSQIIMLDRVLYIGLIIAFILIDITNYKLMVIFDITGKFFSLVYAMYCCRDIVFQRVSTFYFSFKETVINISVGIKLMFANIASMLIIGVVRFGIENSWDVATFGKVSLTLSISNFMLLFINAIGLIMFPILRRTDKNKLSGLYLTIREPLMFILFGVLILYYPIKSLISLWLPNYAESLKYMALLFPMVVYEGKIALLINTYLKVLRKEGILLRINVLSLSLSLILTFITTMLLTNLDFAILSIVILLAFKSIIAEITLSKFLTISIYKNFFFESIIIVVFILTSWLFNSWMTTLFYGIALLFYVFLKRKSIFKSLKIIKSITIK